MRPSLRFESRVRIARPPRDAGGWYSGGDDQSRAGSWQTKSRADSRGRHAMFEKARLTWRMVRTVASRRAGGLLKFKDGHSDYLRRRPNDFSEGSSLQLCNVPARIASV